MDRNPISYICNLIGNTLGWHVVDVMWSHLRHVTTMYMYTYLLDILVDSLCVCVCAGCMGDTQFHFRLRCSGSGAGGSDPDPAHRHHGAPLVLMVSMTL